MESKHHVEPICLCKTLSQLPYKIARLNACKIKCSPCKQGQYRRKCCRKLLSGFMSGNQEDSNNLMIDSNIPVRKAMTAQAYRKLVESRKFQKKTNSTTRTVLVDGVTLRKVCLFRARDKSCPLAVANTRKSIMKGELQKVILVPNTKYVMFRNFKMNTLYQKTVTLQNISKSPAKFQIEGRDSRSKFIVMVKSKNETSKIVPPGMQIQITIFFRCDVVDEPHEFLVINVQHGRTVIIRLRAYRDPPILRVQEMEQPEETSDENICPPTERITISTDSWQTHLQLPSTSQESTGSSCMSILKNAEQCRKRRTSDLNFDCGQCFIGEQTFVILKFQNIGYKGRFFIISDIDWSSMHIEDVSDNNTLILPPFTICPAYFSLNTGEELYLQAGFSPKLDGMHVSKLYILSDNYTLITTDIIGDGILYEPSFIQIDQALKKYSSSGLYVDRRSRYYMKIVIDGENRIINRDINVANISEINIRFRWEKRAIDTEGGDVSHLPEDLLNIHPSCGIFVPFSMHRFTLNIDTAMMNTEEYFIALQLFVEDIPVDALLDETELHYTICNSRRRNCAASVDIWVDDIEIRLQHDYNDEEGGYEKFRDDINSHIFDDDDTFSLLSDNKCLSNNDEDIEAAEFDSGILSNQDLLELTMDELFSKKDHINLKKIQSVLMGYVFTAGVMRVSKNLYVGIQETCTLRLTNKSQYPLLYEWGTACGTDDNKLNVSFDPLKGEILPDQITTVEITLLPVKEGEVRSLYASCCFGNSKNILIMGIECIIAPFNVTFIFPTNQVSKSSEESVTHVNWQADSLKVAFALASRHRRNKVILNKYKLEEEREIEVINLDEGDVHKDIATGPSDVGIKNDLQKINTSTEITDINDARNDKESQESISETKSPKDDADLPAVIVPFYKTVVPRSSKSIVIEFLNLTIGTVQKKMFEIVNETAVRSDVRVTVKNYFPSKNTSKRKESQERIISMYKKAYGLDCHEEEEALSRMKRTHSGVVIVTCPSKSVIAPYGRIAILISVFADTWGTYIDELIIDITGLPRYILGICLEVVGSPIQLPMPKNKHTKAYMFRFGSVKPGNRTVCRNITVKNTSTIPIVINWHTFIVKPNDKEVPFNVVLDLYTPFTDLLAAHVRTKRSTAAAQSMLLSDFKRYNLSKDSWTINSFYETNTSSDNYLSYSFSDSSRSASTYDELFSSDFSIISTSGEPITIFGNASTYNDKIQKAITDTDIKISILPYYGSPDTATCVVNPKEIVIPPKQFGSVSVCVKSDSVPGRDFGKLSYKILGFLRIAPMDKYRDYCYSREDEHYYPPVEIDLEVNFITPRLVYDITKSERTFTFSACAVMESPKKMIKYISSPSIKRYLIGNVLNSSVYICTRMNRTFRFYNYNNDSIDVNFEAHNPFNIQTISTYLEGQPPEAISDIFISGQSGVEVDVTCTVDSELILFLLNDDRYQDLSGSKIILKELFVISHADKSNQTMELILEIFLPSLNLSTHSLNFGRVRIGSEKTMMLTIENATMFKQSFKIEKKYDDNDFVLQEKKGVIPGGRSYSIAIKYISRKVKKSINSLEIQTAIPDFSEDCALCGEGTFDEKYYLPGV